MDFRIFRFKSCFSLFCNICWMVIICYIQGILWKRQFLPRNSQFSRGHREGTKCYTVVWDELWQGGACAWTACSPLPWITQSSLVAGIAWGTSSRVSSKKCSINESDDPCDSDNDNKSESLRSSLHSVIPAKSHEHYMQLLVQNIAL
jgi:hypothetical protein